MFESPARSRVWPKFAIAIIVVVLALLIYVDAKLVDAFSGRLWAQPAQIYARPLSLYDGMELNLDDLQTELTMLGYRFVAAPQRPGQARLSRPYTIVSHGFRFADENEPSRMIQFDLSAGRVIGLTTDDMADVVRLEPLQIGSISPSHKEDRLLVSLSQVPKTLQQLLVASEDRGFYQHHGISVRGISRALLANIKQQRLAQGGSTLTQQLVKNYFLTADRTIRRKLQEAVMAMLLELHLSKDKILESYMNEIYLAQDGPREIHGFGLASEYYFEKSVSELALHEQALLVALVRGPSFYNPQRNPERALARRDLMIDLAAEQGFISVVQATAAKAQPLQVVASANRKSKRMPAYLDLVNRQLREHYSDDDLSAEGLRVFTHFDPVIQASVEAAISTTVAQLPEAELLQAAAIFAKPDSGAVLAVVGDKNPRYPGFNRALDASRQVGSVIKPAVYLTALMQPQRYHLLSPVVDAAFSLPEPDGSLWQPENFDGLSHGEMPLYQAMAKSYNQATAGLGLDVGLAKVAQTIRRLGVNKPVPEFPSLLLGALTLAPIDVAQMYQTLAGNGFLAELNTIDSVLNQHGKVLSRFPLVLEQRIDSEFVTLIRFAMNRVALEGTARSLTWRMPGIAIAGKTGTSNQLRDSWFAGFSGDLLGVVWMGKDDNSPTHITGASGALRAWAAAANGHAKQSIHLDQSDALAFLGYDPATGKIIKQGCEAPMIVPFIKQYAPQYDVACGSAQRIKEFKQRVFEWLH